MVKARDCGDRKSSERPGNTNMEDLSRLRIVEIGDSPFIKNALPAQVSYFSTWLDDDARKLASEGNRAVSLATMPALWRLLRDPETALVVCHPTYFSPWSWRWILRTLFDRRILRGSLPVARAMGPQFLRWPCAAPIAILDREDLPVVNRNNFFLLDRCRVYFKRELPPDRWRVFMKTGHANLPTPRFRKSERYQARIDRLRPISLGLRAAPSPVAVAGAEKSADIFFAGTVAGSSFVRQRGLSELLALRDRGFVVDIPERPLPQSEFYRRCAQARLTWSPEGLGWDCFRHYEAAMCESVPLLNQPTIERYQPLLQGTHAVYYEVEQGGLTRAAVSALADRPRLQTMALAARDHVLAHHTPEAIARHVVRTTLATMVTAMTRGNDEGAGSPRR
jgi:hypothetical protein